MRNIVITIITTAALLLLQSSDVNSDQMVYVQNDTAGAHSFMSVDIMIDVGDGSVSAYQFELKVISGNAVLSGIEGGDCEAFSSPGFYDSRALNKGRIKLADFNLEKSSPHGIFRCARLHFMVSDSQQPEFEIIPVVLADAQGDIVKGKIYVK